MDIEKHTRAHDDMNTAFDNGSVFQSSPEDIERYLASIGSLPILSDQVRTKAVIRALCLNHLQMSRVVTNLRTALEKLNADNGKVAQRIYWLTWVCAACALIQAIGVFWMIFLAH